MKNFISVKDVSDISMLVKEAMAYKADPFKDKLLGSNKRIGLLISESQYAYEIEYTDCCAEPGDGSDCV